MPRTAELLKEMQAYSLEDKVQITKARIWDFYEFAKNNDHACHVSFSGGKDSTVLLHIARQIYPDMKAVFCDTGLEYPEIKDFVHTFPNVDTIRPTMNFKEVLEKYGYCFPTKEIAHRIESARKGAHGLKWFNGDYFTNKKGYLYMMAINNKHHLDDPFIYTSKCCNVMKKAPFHKYERANKSYPIYATLAEESIRRQTNWKRNGCNNTSSVRPNSQPMAIWTNQDILRYLQLNNLPICSIYGQIVEINGKLTTTEANRTGCIFCVAGIKIENRNTKRLNRFERLAQTHPALHKYCMHTLGLKAFLDYHKIRTGYDKYYQTHI